MLYKEQTLKDVFLIEATPNEDDRGLFRRHFCEKELSANGIEFSAKQGNISENSHPYTLRGFHYQKAPSRESKIISCISGSIYNVMIDLRKESPTFLQWQVFHLSAIGRESLYVPVGCANAFLTMEKNTWVHYYMNDFFSIESSGFRYNDPLFSIPWPAEPLHMSEKDKNYPDLFIGSL